MAQQLPPAGVHAVVEGITAYLNDLKKMAGANDGLNKNLEKTGTTAGSVAKGIIAADLAMKGMRQAWQLGAGSAIAFEDAFAGVRKTVNGSPAELEAISDGIRDMAKEIPVGTTAIAGIAAAAGQLGIQTDNVLEFSRVMADLGVSTNLSGEQAATSLARLANITQMSQDDFDRLGSTIVALGNNFATTEADIVSMAMRIAGAGNQIGLSEAQILAFSTALSSVGIEAEAGGSAISKVMIDIAMQVETGGEKLQTLADVAGMTVGEFQQLFERDAATAVAAFITGLGRMQEEGRSTFGVLEELEYTEVRMRDALLRASGAGDLLTEALGLSGQAWKDNTALAKEAEQRYGTTASQIQILKNQVNDLGIELGTRLLPALNAIIGGIGGALQAFGDLPPFVQNMIALGAAATAASMVMPRLITNLGELAVALKGVNLAAVGVVGAIVAIAAGVDEVLKRKTGDGLFAHIMGKADSNKRAREAAQAIQDINDAFIEGEKRIPAYRRELEKQVEAYNAATEAAGDAAKNIQFSTDAQRDGLKDQAQAEANIRALAKAMDAAGVSAGELWEIYKGLPESQKAVWDEETNIVRVMQLRSEEEDRMRLTMELRRREQDDTTVAVEEGVVAEKDSVTVLAELAEATKEAEKANKLLRDSITDLIDAFGAANPEVHRLQAENAFLQLSIDKIKNSTDELTPAQEKLIEGYEAQIDANNRAIDSNVMYADALHGSKEAMINILGADGYQGLLDAMDKVGVAGSDQTAIVNEVFNAYNDLASGAIGPAAESFEGLKSVLSPDAWATIAEAVGPAFIGTITDAYTGQERDDLLLAAYDLGFMTFEEMQNAAEDSEDHLAATIGSTMTGALSQTQSFSEWKAEAERLGEEGIQGVADGFSRGAETTTVVDKIKAAAKTFLSAFQTEIESKSPSKLFAREAGYPMAEGVAVGWVEGFDKEVLPLLARWGEQLEQVIEQGGKPAIEAVRVMLADAASTIDTAPLSDSARKKARETVASFTAAINEGKAPSATALQNFLLGLEEDIVEGFEKLRFNTEPKLDEWLESVTKRLTDEKPDSEAALQSMMNSLESILNGAPMSEAARELVDEMVYGFREGIATGGGLALAELQAFIAQLLGAAKAGAAEVDGVLSGAETKVLGSDGKWYSPGDLPAGDMGYGTPTRTHDEQAKASRLLDTYRNASVSGNTSTGKPINYVDMQAIIGAVQAGWIAASDLNDAEKAAVSAWYDQQARVAGTFGQAPLTRPAGFKRGTPFVEQDMLALIHRGEMIVPEQYNPFASVAASSRMGGGDRSVSIDMSHSQFTGTMEDNEAMIRRVVEDVLDDESDRGAFIAGARN